jgi:heat shock protein beta
MRLLWVLLFATAVFTEEVADDSQISEEIDKGESFLFQTEVSNFMDIIINSLYMHKEVFLRELISNASDAMDKVKFKAMKDSKFNAGDMQMKISFDAKAKTLSIEDRGIGMTKNDLIEKLGTVAKSGTTQFIEAIAQGDGINLIG